ncbi:hypothetical protein [Kitasatospora indigofera]|uniref:hypothetical protein n=1 Tax=Kitasatospora indigofera TaxID=67307 RepID=UPI00167D3DE6|nr:hypothetical protein [Kitasatospora indigofera]
MPRIPFVTAGSPGQARAIVEARAIVQARAIVAVAVRTVSTSRRPDCTVRAGA